MTRLSRRDGSRAGQGGFTLVEVMVSLAILATALVVLVSVTAADVREAQRAQMLNVATNLARAKIFDLEEELLREGFQQTDQEESGDFRDQEWDQISWTAEIRTIELPSLQNIGGQGTEDALGEGGDAAATSDNPLTGMLSSFGLGGQLEGAEGAGAGLIQSQFQMIQEILKQSIRKISLTVEWTAFGADNCTPARRARIYQCVAQGDGCDDRELWDDSIRCEKLVVDYYVTDPAAISRVVGGAGAPAGGQGDGDGDDGGASPGGNTGGTTGRPGGTTGRPGGRGGGATPGLGGGRRR